MPAVDGCEGNKVGDGEYFRGNQDQVLVADRIGNGQSGGFRG